MTTRRPMPAPPVPPTRTTEIRHGRNFIRKGDLVRIAPQPGSTPGTWGMTARFQYAEIDNGGLFYACVEQAKNEKGILVSAGWRFVRPERVERKATTHDPRRQVEVRAQARKAAA